MSDEKPKKPNGIARMKYRIAELEFLLSTARADALREAVSLCIAFSRRDDVNGYEKMTGIELADAIRALIPEKP